MLTDEETYQEIRKCNARFANAMDLLNKPNNAYWFRKSSAAYLNQRILLGKLYSWLARRNLYKQDWRDIRLLIEYGKI